MSEPNSSNNHNPEPPKSKSNRYKKILKRVFWVTSACWSAYKRIGKLIEFIEEYLG
jgi:hypothetical protein